MDYSNYTSEDFVLDDYFQKWVAGKLPEEDTFWPDWVREHPEKGPLISQATFVLKALDMDHEPISDQKVREKVRQIIDNATDKPVSIHPFYQSLWFRAAAAVTLLLGLGWYLMSQQKPAPMLYDELVIAQPQPLLEKINNSDQPLRISLSDGSVITLQPNGKLSYPERFETDKREVYLLGEGMFEITKNPKQPFYVYANELTTKVLGTRFSVKAYANDKAIIVKVFTGKVSVQTRNPPAHSSEQPFNQREGIILTPNQMAVYDRPPAHLTRTLVENPVLVKTTPENKPDFHFENTPVSQVFERLEQGYGVKIVYDSDQLKNCTVTAPFDNESLYEKLNLICKVIRASYEVIDTQIVISSRGCN
ncbi:FecR family protein [Spirosoma arboris]|nr:FecR family protein [Spirosoma arboris]